MLMKIEEECIDGNDAIDKSKGNVSKAEDTIEAAQKEINVRFVNSGLLTPYTTYFSTMHPHYFRRNLLDHIHPCRSQN